jgi:hypothetical protein
MLWGAMDDVMGQGDVMGAMDDVWGPWMMLRPYCAGHG